MSRVKYFLYGGATGAAGYLSLSFWTQNKLRNVENQITNLHQELSGLPPNVELKSGPQSLLEEYRRDITRSFRANWNRGLDRVYKGTQEMVDSIMSPAPAAVEAPTKEVAAPAKEAAVEAETPAVAKEEETKEEA